MLKADFLAGDIYSPAFEVASWIMASQLNPVSLSLPQTPQTLLRFQLLVSSNIFRHSLRCRLLQPLTVISLDILLLRFLIITVT